MFKKLVLSLIFLTLTISAFSQIKTNTITEKGAWCWFADPRAIHYKNDKGTINSTYIGYIDAHGYIKATQINHLTNTTNEVMIRSYFQPDDHNNPTFLVLPDERIMIFYSRHTDEPCFYYRVSQKPGDISTLGKEVRLATENNTTYPSPFILSDDPNHIYLCWRGINWHPTIAKLSIPDAQDNTKFEWGPFQMVRSNNGAGGVRPYAKYVTNGKDKIYLAYTTTHPDNQSTNFIYLNYMDINTKELKDIKGKKLAKVGDPTMHEVNATASYKQNYPDAVIDDSPFRNWLWEVAIDKEDKPVIATVSISNDKKSHDYNYVRWTGQQWQKTFIANAGGHFHQTPNIENCYSAGMAVDKTDANIIYGSVPVDGKYGRIYELKKYTIGDNGKVANEQQLTFNSQKNNVRPFMIANKSGKNALTWMYGDYYDWIVSATRPKGYATGIRTDMTIPLTKLKLKKGLILQKNKVEINATTNHPYRVPKSNSFSINLNLSIDTAAYYGEFVKFAGLTYGLPKNDRPKPYLKSSTNNYESTNVLGNSDVWQSKNRGTGGQWYLPTKLNKFQLSFTYKDGVLRSYINGLIDQSVIINDLNLSDLIIGEFKGSVADLKIYKRELSQDEIKSLAINNQTF